MLSKKVRLRRKADRLWFEKYLKDKCEICGEDKYLQGHHFFYKGVYPHLRYSAENHITLCRRCHFILHHRDPKEITDKIIEKRGRTWYYRLKKKSKELKASFQTIRYYEDIIKKLEKC